MELKFRTLHANEIECRVATVSEKGCSLLLYKDARVDQNLLDEIVGAMNWQRSHSRDNANCTVSIWDSEKNMWVSKEDTGKESNTEAEKGLASDSFKRACFNWGIGRELYTAPFIWVGNDKCEIKKHPKTGKPTCTDKFSVTEIKYNDSSEIVSITIRNETKKCVAYTNNKNNADKGSKKSKVESEVEYATTVEKKSLLATCEEHNIDINDILAKVGCTDKLTSEQYGKALVLVSEIIENKGDK